MMERIARSRVVARMRYLRERRVLEAYSVEDHVAQQRRTFAAFGADYDAGVARLQETLDRHPELDSKHMRSEHHTLFAALSASRQATRILEIGTFNGKTAGLLARLFPQATIDTMDLPDDERWSADVPTPPEERKRFLRERDELLAKHDNVRFVPASSAILSVVASGSYDLVWVDGDHRFPLVAIDIANAVRLAAPGGIVACDDVRLRVRDESNSTLELLEASGLADVHRIYKRLNANHNAIDARRKHVGVALLRPEAATATTLDELIARGSR